MKQKIYSVNLSPEEFRIYQEFQKEFGFVGNMKKKLGIGLTDRQKAARDKKKAVSEIRSEVQKGVGNNSTRDLAYNNVDKAVSGKNYNLKKEDTSYLKKKLGETKEHYQNQLGQANQNIVKLGDTVKGHEATIANQAKTLATNEAASNKALGKLKQTAKNQKQVISQQTKQIENMKSAASKIAKSLKNWKIGAGATAAAGVGLAHGAYKLGQRKSNKEES